MKIYLGAGHENILLEKDFLKLSKGKLLYSFYYIKNRKDVLNEVRKSKKPEKAYFK